MVFMRVYINICMPIRHNPSAPIDNQAFPSPMVTKKDETYASVILLSKLSKLILLKVLTET